MRKPVIAGILLVVVAFAATAAVAQKINPHGIPATANAFGKTYGEWSAAWWQWALSIPANEHPLFEKGNCATGQSGPVWFIGGKFCASSSDIGCVDPMNIKVERSCTVPAGTALFFPILNGEDSIIEELNFMPNPREADLRANVKSWLTPSPDGFKATATVDGKPLRPVRICVSGDACVAAESPLFTFKLAEHDNILAAIGETWVADGATSSAVSDGYYVLIPPLPPGEHTVAFYGLNGNFSLDITYRLAILP